MYKILVTGGAGYIGSVLTPMLLKRGYSVTVLDSFIYRQSSLLDCCNDPNLHIINGDCRNGNVLKRAMDGADFIFPLAAIVGFPACDKDMTAAVSTNQGAIDLLLRLCESGQRIVFPCTNSGYGLGQGQKLCTEESPIMPVSLYGKTKMAAEKAVLDSGNSLTFRFATLFGASPRMRTDLLVNDFVYRACFDKSLVVFEGGYRRNFLHVRDAAGAFLFAVDHFEQMKGKCYNCGLSNANISKLELCQKIKEHIPDFFYTEAQIGTDPDKRDYIVSNERIEKIGYRPEYDLDMGIDELIKAYSVIKNSFYGNV